MDRKFWLPPISFQTGRSAFSKAYSTAVLCSGWVNDGEYHTTRNQVVQPTLIKMSATKGKTGAAAKIFNRRELRFWEECRLGAIGAGAA
jgi:hypothetical protein